MKVVIEIPRYIAALCVENNISDPIDIKTLIQAVKNGIPLPKRHGRLIDADKLPLNDIDDANHGSNYIRIAPTIIEADKEVIQNDD